MIEGVRLAVPGGGSQHYLQVEGESKEFSDLRYERKLKNSVRNRMVAKSLES